MKRIYIFVIIFTTSCSFQSTQLDLISSIFSKKNDNLELNWVVSWLGAKTDVYAINNNNYIYFVNYDEYFIEFNGWQITKVNGFLSQDRNIEIISKDEVLTYLVNNKQLLTLICDSWVRSLPNREGYVTHQQECFNYDLGYNFTNHIIINDLGQIISLKYKVHPDYPKIMINFIS